MTLNVGRKLRQRETFLFHSSAVAFHCVFGHDFPLSNQIKKRKKERKREREKIRKSKKKTRKEREK